MKNHPPVESSPDLLRNLILYGTITYQNISIGHRRHFYSIETHSLVTWTGHFFNMHVFHLMWSITTKKDMYWLSMPGIIIWRSERKIRERNEKHVKKKGCPVIGYFSRRSQKIVESQFWGCVFKLLRPNIYQERERMMLHMGNITASGSTSEKCMMPKVVTTLARPRDPTLPLGWKIMKQPVIHISVFWMNYIYAEIFL